MAEVNIDVAKEASVQAVNSKVGTASDAASSNPTTLFAGIKGLIAWFTGTWTAARAAKIDTVGVYQSGEVAYSGTELSDSQFSTVVSQATINGKLNTILHWNIGRPDDGNNGITRTIHAKLNRGCVKSVQKGLIGKGTYSTGYITYQGQNKFYVDVTLSAINTAKATATVNTMYATSNNYLTYEITSATNLRIWTFNSTATPAGPYATDWAIRWELIEFN